MVQGAFYFLCGWMKLSYVLLYFLKYCRGPPQPLRMKFFRGIAEGIWPYPGGRYTEKGWVWSRILEGILPQAVILTSRTSPAQR